MNAYIRLVTAQYLNCGVVPGALADFIKESHEKQEAYACPRRAYDAEYGQASAGSAGVRTFKVSK